MMTTYRFQNLYAGGNFIQDSGRGENKIKLAIVLMLLIWFSFLLWSKSRILNDTDCVKSSFFILEVFSCYQLIYWKFTLNYVSVPCFLVCFPVFTALLCTLNDQAIDKTFIFSVCASSQSKVKIDNFTYTKILCSLDFRWHKFVSPFEAQIIILIASNSKMKQLCRSL